MVLCRRKGGSVPPPSGPAHWSTTVTVTPECRPRSGLGPTNGDPHMVRRHEHDRMALIAFADGMQQVSLPSYEEALRDGVNVNHTGSNNNNNNNIQENDAAGLPVNAETAMIATTEFDSSSVAAAQVDVAASSRHVLYACSGMAAPTGCTNTHPHYRQQQQQQGRYQQQAAAVSSRSRSRQHSSRSSTRDHHDQHQGDQATASMWPARPHYRLVHLILLYSTC